MAASLIQVSNMIANDQQVISKNKGGRKSNEFLSFGDIEGYESEFLKDKLRTVKDDKSPKIDFSQPLTGQKGEIQVKKAEAFIALLNEKLNSDKKKSVLNPDLEISETLKGLPFENGILQAISHLEPEQQQIILTNLEKPISNSPVLQEILHCNNQEEQVDIIQEFASKILENKQTTGKPDQISKSVINVTGEMVSEKANNIVKGTKIDISAQNSQETPNQPATKNVGAANVLNHNKFVEQSSAEKLPDIKEKNDQSVTPNSAQPDGKTKLSNEIWDFSKSEITIENNSKMTKQAIDLSFKGENESKTKIAAQQFNISPSPDAPLGKPSVFSKPSNSVFSPIPTNDVTSQVSHNIKTNFVGTDKDLTISLSPPELGKITIKFNEINKEITGRLEVDKAEVKADIERSLPEIIKTLQNVGVNIKKVEVALNTKNENMGQDAGTQMEGREKSGQWQDDQRFDQEDQEQLDENFEPENQPQVITSNDDSLNIYL